MGGSTDGWSRPSIICCVKNSRSGLSLDTSRLNAGLRLAVGVSGGADSVALLSALGERIGELGLVLRVVHLHHGLRGAEADQDLEFVRELALKLGLEFVSARVDTAAEARDAGETVEEAARRLRYGWFRELMAARVVDAVATAHTLDDQAETVLGKILRGAWTQGMAGVHPVVEFPEGRVIRPLLAVRRAEVESYLRGRGQEWREDSTNRQVTFTRNRIRHELLPLLEGWNPKLKEHLAQMAELARDEESWWAAEVARVAPEVMLTGRPVRGGGRAAADGLVVLDVAKLAGLDAALQRRVLRHAVERLGADLDFAGTEKLRELALSGRAGQKCELAGGLRAERSHRELRLSMQAAGRITAEGKGPVEVPIPGEGEGFGVRVSVETPGTTPQREDAATAVLRAWKAGDRVQLRYASGLRKVKEVLERMKISGAERAAWPVLELAGRIVWMQGVEVEPAAGIRVTAKRVEDGGSHGGS